MQRPPTRSSALTTLLVRGLACAFVLGAVFAAVHVPSEPGASAAPAPASAVTEPWTATQAKPDGQKLYLTRCMSCHQMDGQGVTGTFPPLDGSEWVTGDKGRLVRVVLHGVSGEIVVDGTKYNGAMPGWGTFMNDAEVAALATYVRTAWSNDASAVTPAEVKAIRAAHPDRKQPWTAPELKDPANLGVPGAKASGS